MPEQAIIRHIPPQPPADQLEQPVRWRVYGVHACGNPSAPATSMLIDDDGWLYLFLGPVIIGEFPPGDHHGAMMDPELRF